MIQSVTPVSRVYNQPKGFNSYHQSHKITALPPELSVDKPKKKTWSELLCPWLLTVGFVLFVAMLNGLIGE